MSLIRALTLSLSLVAAPAAVAQAHPSHEVTTLAIREALLQHATLPTHPPVLPSTAADRAQQALQERPLPRAIRQREVQNVTEAHSDKGAKGAGRAEEVVRGRSAAAMNANVNAAAQAAAGQARAAEVKQNAQRRGPPETKKAPGKP